jgi:hypothetical protein
MAGVMVSLVPTEASPFSFFTIKASPCKSTRGEEEVGAGAMGDARGEDNDAEGDDGGMTLVDCLGESLSSKRGILQWRLAVFVLMIANVEMLSGSKPNTQTPAYNA